MGAVMNVYWFCCSSHSHLAVFRQNQLRGILKQFRTMSGVRSVTGKQSTARSEKNQIEPPRIVGTPVELSGCRTLVDTSKLETLGTLGHSATRMERSLCAVRAAPFTLEQLHTDQAPLSHKVKARYDGTVTSCHTCCTF